jgi:hypothetical protein
LSGLLFDCFFQSVRYWSRCRLTNKTQKDLKTKSFVTIMWNDLEDMLELSAGEAYSLSDDELQKKYLILCRKYHPDSKSGQGKDFKDIERSYQQLLKLRKEPLRVSVTLNELFHGSSCQLPSGDTVTIPAGSYNGAELVSLKGRPVLVDEVPGGFLRRGADLYCHLHISLIQALVGHPVQIAHPLGNLTVPVQIPNTDYNHVLRGCGMPIPGYGSGDLYIVYHVTFPEKVSLQAIEALNECTSSYRLVRSE